MAKYYVTIGYNDHNEVLDGISTEIIVEKKYTGDVTKIFSRVQSSERMYDNVVSRNVVSIVADPYAILNFQKIRYVVYMNHKWKTTSVEIKYPRIVIDLGEMYNEEIV